MALRDGAANVSFAPSRYAVEEQAVEVLLLHVLQEIGGGDGRGDLVDLDDDAAELLYVHLDAR